MVDSHCHLDFPDYQGDFDAVLERTKSALDFVVNVGTDVRTSERAVELAEANPFIYAAVGVHPHDATTVTSQAADRLKTLAVSKRVVAIGECGLDYAKLTPGEEETEKRLQRQAFEAQIEVARERKLPLIIHCRDAYDDLLIIFRQSQLANRQSSDTSGEERRTSGELRGVIHCYLGSAATAQELMSMGFYISFTGIITFKNASPELLESVRQVPLERMLLETDAPFLTPVPYRGKRNEPAYVVGVAKKVAELKAVPYEEVDRVTTHNARTLFSIT